ncbi:hypothetical protein [Paenibacillus polymyxa]|uniref:hypothetical protein n=1 Tax=Paenibacillus polymyxa TaxID=1406 RepID=UPI002ED0F042|nr:hypothetical protein [Paenibacillus polymyxa]
MNEAEKRRAFQKIKSLSTKNFYRFMDATNSDAYDMAIKHMTEAMSCDPKISKPTINRVLAKAEEIRTLWDGINTYTADKVYKFDGGKSN